MIIAVGYSNAIGQCAGAANIYSFIYNGNTYEVVRENKTWINAAACAVQRGGILAEINNVAEQNAIFSELNSNASINVIYTAAPDGGGASYVWIGGNDLATEGDWVWDGNNDNSSTQFWLGTSTGSPVGGLYNNWGNEPDDYLGQDALGLALINWPLGVAGQWNDVDHTNSLYYVIEYSGIVGINDTELEENIEFYPNPFKGFVTIESNNLKMENVVVINSIGQEVKVLNVDGLYALKIDLSSLESGVYFMRASFKDGRSITKTIVK